MSHNNLREWVEKNYATSLEPKIYFVLIVIFLDKFEEKAISNYEVFNNENGSAHKDTLHHAWHDILWNKNDMEI